MNGADLLCDTLLANGVEVCFANPGTSEMHFVAALDRKPELRCVLGMFEGVVTGAADGYARMTGKPAATLLHTGPGLANGLANLHNARRAGTPVVNVVGDHASYHLVHDAPLTSDIEGLARPMSAWVGRASGPADVSARAAEAIAAATGPEPGVATLILPADAAWTDTPPQEVARARPAAPARATAATVEATAAALRENRAETLLMLGGASLSEEGLRLAGAIAEATGAGLIAQQSNARMARGQGRVAIDRVPYPMPEALARLKDTRRLILCGAKSPVGFFAYPNLPSTPLPEGCEVSTLAGPGEDALAALADLAQALGLPAGAAPKIESREKPALPQGALTPDTIAATVGALLPEGAIVCDESVTSGRDFFRLTHAAAPHDFLQLTGGAIGLGLPMSVGAAVACPDRKVVTLQADGSGMYTVQALWTMARERLDTLVIVFSNRSYRILHGELKSVGAGSPGRNARSMLDLDDPALDWVSMARGMGVEAARAETAESFTDLFRAALGRKGPFLIEALI
ncbi:acetolactate synthase large subunit [Acidimangrovimonas sediminis]|uniref:acetolactate synthase large subunit n=1 Tax=Acidimangrovimonas sediminis TaxID=2056283 RepID=UPI000C809BBF|nr:acetolactate synthase large subunit [Acidimangrovimonas sediminis]